MTDKRRCPDCKGRGRQTLDEHFSVECKTCKGHGAITIEKPVGKLREVWQGGWKWGEEK